MKNEEIKFKNLVNGTYYKATFKENPKGIIFKFNVQIGNKHYYINLDGMYFNNEVILTCRPQDNTYIKLSKQEEHWLNCCIKANEFISYEESMKTFIEESELYDISKLTSYPEGYKKLKKGDKAILFKIDTSPNCKSIPLGSVIIIDEDNSTVPFILYNNKRYCCSTCELAPIPENNIVEPENTSLVGRYLKALVDKPNGTPYKKDDYIQIIIDNSETYNVRCAKSFIFGCNSYNWSESGVELMSEGFKPKEIKIDSIPEYVKCIKGKNCSFHNKVGTIYKVKNYDLKNKQLQLENYDNTISYIDFKNPISSNLTDYIISSKTEYDLQNKPKEMKKVEDLVYPDVIELESQEQLDKILKYNPRLYKSFKRYMLFGEKDAKIGWGTSTSYSDIFYNNYKFSDIIFPEETTKQYDYEVVHCTTQEEWDFACDKYNKGIYVKEQFVKYGYNTFVMSNFSGWNKKEFFLSDPLYNKSLKIYTFKEYCDKFGYTPDFIEKEEWIPQIGEWVVALETIGDLITKNKIYQLKKVDSFGFYHLCDDGTTNGYDSSKYRLAFPHEIPNNQQNDQTIDIGDTVSTSDGNGIVIGITTSNKYLVKGAYKFHNGKDNTLIKGNFSDKDDSYYYDLDELTLVKKANKSYIDIAGETVKLVYNVQLPIIGNIPTKTIFTFDIDIPKIKKDTIIELDTNLLKNIKKPIKF
jgi:hypothetical protein